MAIDRKEAESLLSSTQILEKIKHPSNFFEETLHELISMLGNEKPIQNDFQLVIDEIIKEGHPDPNLFLFFLSSSLLFLIETGQDEKAHAFEALAQSLLPQVKIHPTVKLFHKMNIAYACFAHIPTRKNAEKAISLMTECVALADETMHDNALSRLYSLLSVGGTLKEHGYSALEEKFLKESSKTAIVHYNAIFQNSVSIFHKRDSLHYYKKMLSCIDEPSAKTHIERATLLLYFAQGLWDETLYPDEKWKYLIRILCALSSSDVETAIRIYQQAPTRIAASTISDFLPLHFDLCLRKSASAMMLLQKKQAMGDTYYIDNLFLGRILLLENDISGAYKAFQQLLKDIKKYDAFGRLEFELQLSKELNFSVALALMQGELSIDQLYTSCISRKEIVIPKTTLRRGIERIVGESKPITQTKALIKKYAVLKAPILVTGETGTGKELIAQALHEESPNHNEPFLAINCGALTDGLLQSELFGYEIGAFTGANKPHKGIFESAGMGTVFLDEFGDISPKLQTALLRVLELNEIRPIGSSKTRKIQCKIIIATNTDLQEAVKRKQFREDLYFRLMQLGVYAPPLHQRKEDIPLLIRHFLESHTTSDNAPIQFTEELILALQKYDWPGNIRELRNEVNRTCILNPLLKTIGYSEFDFTCLKAYTNMAPSETISVPLVFSHTNIEKNNHHRSVKEIVESGFTTEKRYRALKDLFKEHQKLTRKQISEIFKLSTSTITKDLRKLCDENFIIRRCPTNSPRTDYFECLEEPKK